MSHLLFIHSFIFFFKQKTAYEMRISDWSSDMCSSDLRNDILITNGAAHGIFLALASLAGPDDVVLCEGVTDHGVIGNSQVLGFTLKGLEMDRYGIDPEHFEDMCSNERITALVDRKSVV